MVSQYKLFFIKIRSEVAANKNESLFRLPSNEIVLKDCKPNGSLVSLNSAVKKCPWILLKLKVFTIQNLDYPVWMCSACEQCKAMESMHTVQNPGNFKHLLCHHSKVVFELVSDWESYLTQDEDPSSDVCILQYYLEIIMSS